MEDWTSEVPYENLDNAVYLLKLRHPRKNVTYLGSTNDTDRRWLQHDGKRSGGAKFTKRMSENNRYKWDPVCVVRGFPTRNMAYSFEKRAKHIKLSDGADTLAEYGTHDQNNRLIHPRVRKMIVMCNLERWTQKCPLASATPVRFEWYMPKMKPQCDEFLRRDWDTNPNRKVHREVARRARDYMARIQQAVPALPKTNISEIIVPYLVRVPYLPYYVQEIVMKA